MHEKGKKAEANVKKNDVYDPRDFAISEEKRAGEKRANEKVKK